MQFHRLNVHLHKAGPATHWRTQRKFPNRSDQEGDMEITPFSEREGRCVTSPCPLFATALLPSHICDCALRSVAVTNGKSLPEQIDSTKKTSVLQGLCAARSVSFSARAHPAET